MSKSPKTRKGFSSSLDLSVRSIWCFSAAREIVYIFICSRPTSLMHKSKHFAIQRFGTWVTMSFAPSRSNFGLIESSQNTTNNKNISWQTWWKVILSDLLRFNILWSQLKKWLVRFRFSPCQPHAKSGEREKQKKKGPHEKLLFRNHIQVSLLFRNDASEASSYSRFPDGNVLKHAQTMAHGCSPLMFPDTWHLRNERSSNMVISIPGSHSQKPSIYFEENAPTSTNFGISIDAQFSNEVFAEYSRIWFTLEIGYSQLRLAVYFNRVRYHLLQLCRESHDSGFGLTYKNMTPEPSKNYHTAAVL